MISGVMGSGTHVIGLVEPVGEWTHCLIGYYSVSLGRRNPIGGCIERIIAGQDNEGELLATSLASIMSAVRSCKRSQPWNPPCPSPLRSLALIVSHPFVPPAPAISKETQLAHHWHKTANVKVCPGTLNPDEQNWTAWWKARNANSQTNLGIARTRLRITGSVLLLQYLNCGWSSFAAGKWSKYTSDFFAAGIRCFCPSLLRLVFFNAFNIPHQLLVLSNIPHH